MSSDKMTLAQRLAETRKTPEVPASKPEPVFNAMATKRRRGKRGLTVYLRPEAHAVVKEVAGERGQTLEEFIIESLNLNLLRNGRKPIA